MGNDLDHDLLIRIDENVKAVKERLKAGAETMENLEVRIKAVENACTPRNVCDARHRYINGTTVTILLGLLVASIGIIGILLDKILKAR